MTVRLRLLRGATALLYFGPLLAGIGGFGWGIVPVFAAIFLLWLFILRPQQWPRRMADWTRSEAVIALLTQGVVQVFLVTVSFGIGRGIGGVLGVMPPFPLMLPIAISFLSIPLARLIWDPWKAEATGGDLDTALARQVGADEDAEVQLAAARRMVFALNRLGAETAPDVLAQHLRAMAPSVSQVALRLALTELMQDGTASPAQRRAAIVHATEPEIADQLVGTGYAGMVFRSLADSADLRLFARRCAELVALAPGARADCPRPDEVEHVARAMPEATADLRALVSALAGRP